MEGIRGEHPRKCQCGHFDVSHKSGDQQCLANYEKCPCDKFTPTYSDQKRIV